MQDARLPLPFPIPMFWHSTEVSKYRLLTEDRCIRLFPGRLFPGCQVIALETNMRIITRLPLSKCFLQNSYRCTNVNRDKC